MTIGPSKIVPKKIKKKIKNTPYLRRIAYPYYAKYLRLHLKLITWWKVSRKYEAKITPFDVIYVSPKKIKYSSTNNPIKKNEKRNLIPRVVNGNWDQETTPFEEFPVYKSCKARFLEEKDWKDTERYQDMEKAFKTENVVGGVSSPKQRETYFENLEMLFKDIEENGYQSQREISIDKKDFHVHRTMVVDRYLRETNEVQINIGRNGTYLFHDGRHRLSIAKILNIQKIPVRIYIRHQKWQEKRDKAVKEPEKLSEHQKTHPDIEYLIQKKG